MVFRVPTCPHRGPGRWCPPPRGCSHSRRPLPAGVRLQRPRSGGQCRPCPAALRGKNQRAIHTGHQGPSVPGLTPSTEVTQAAVLTTAVGYQARDRGLWGLREHATASWPVGPVLEGVSAEPPPARHSSVAHLQTTAATASASRSRWAWRPSPHLTGESSFSPPTTPARGAARSGHQGDQDEVDGQAAPRGADTRADTPTKRCRFVCVMGSRGMKRAGSALRPRKALPSPVCKGGPGPGEAESPSRAELDPRPPRCATTPPRAPHEHPAPSSHPASWRAG